MSLDFCIPDMLARGEITREQAEQLDALYGEIKTHYSQTMGPAAAAAAATKDAVVALERQAVKRARNKLQQVASQRAIALDLMKYGQGQGGLRKLDLTDPAVFREAIMGLFYRRDQAPYMNVEFQHKVVLMQAQSRINGILEKHSRNIAGEVRYKADLDDLVDELYAPGSTGSTSARELADAFSQTAEMLRVRFNAAGGDIAKLDGWALPQSHDGEAIMAAGFDNWLSQITPRLDRTKMIDRATGAPFTDKAYSAVMRDVYDAITTDGWSTRNPSGGFQGSSLSNRGMDHRFLHFKDGQAWREYNAQFGGQASPFDIINGHLYTMARDIALMERLGPNPASTVRFLQQSMQKQVATTVGRGGSDVANATAKAIDRAYKYLAGVDRAPENRKLAMAFGTARNLQVAGKLGSAVLSTTSDQVFNHMTRKFNGLSKKFGIVSQLRMLNPLDKEHQAWAARGWIVNEELAGMGATMQRLEGGEISHEVSRRLAEGVLRGFGLSKVTQMNRRAHAFDTLNDLTTYAPRSFDKLPRDFAGMLERHGMGAREWDMIRATPLEDHRGTGWIRPDNMAPAIRDRVMRMVFAETDMAVPVPTAEWSAQLQNFATAGTLPGEIAKSAAQFKSFTIGAWREQYRRSIAMTPWRAASYASQLFVYLTIAGAVSVQLKQVAKGQQLRTMADFDDEEGRAETAAFWRDAVFQGGGMGILGDAINQAMRGQAGAAAASVAGPLFSAIDQTIFTPAAMAWKDATRGEDEAPANWGRWSVKTIKKEVPVTSSLSSGWFTRAAFERLILDEMQRELDPKFEQAWKDEVRRAEKNGGGFVWAPGDGGRISGQYDVNALTGDEPAKE